MKFIFAVADLACLHCVFAINVFKSVECSLYLLGVRGTCLVQGLESVESRNSLIRGEPVLPISVDFPGYEEEEEEEEEEKEAIMGKKCNLLDQVNYIPSPLLI